MPRAALLAAALALAVTSRGDVVVLAAGQPTAGAPAPVKAAADKALREQNLGYTVQLGIPELRDAIAGHYARRYALDVSPEDVVVTTGSSGGFLLSFLSAFEVGDRDVEALEDHCSRSLHSAIGTSPKRSYA